MELLKILSASGEWHDYSQYVILRGYSWKRSDLDSSKSGRTKDLRMRRDKLGTKRSVTYEVRGMTRQQIAQLDDDLSQVSFNVIYEDLHGSFNKEFYCANFSANLNTTKNEGPNSWQAEPFTITEM